MQESSRYAVGIDIGTTTVRCVVGHIDATTGAPTIVGVGSVANSGMRKGTVANLNGPAKALDDALIEAERMSGYQVGAATISINGAHILSTKADGMIAVGAIDHEIVDEDLARLEDVATSGKVPANRTILEVVPHEYRLDGQDGIRDPLGMTGTRLEIKANVISALTPNVTQMQRVAEIDHIDVRGEFIPAVVGAAHAVLAEQQRENGVAVIDLGGATTSIAIFEEGDLQFVSVIPMGGASITNDLAIGLKTDPEVAERVKIEHASALAASANETVTVVVGDIEHSFSQSEVHDIVEARLEEMYELIQKALKKAGRAGKLPSGVVLTGGTAHLKGIVDYTKETLGVAARIGAPKGYGGVAEHLDEPQFATAVGLMLIDAEGAPTQATSTGQSKHGGIDAKKKAQQASGFLSGILNRFKP